MNRSGAVMMATLATAASLAVHGATLYFAGDSTLDDHRGDESTYGKDGLLVDHAHLDDWAEAMRETAAELGADLVDMRVLTREAANKAGEAEALTWNAPGDRTHPAVKGARLYAQLFLADVKGRALPIAGLFRNDAPSPLPISSSTVENGRKSTEDTEP